MVNMEFKIDKLVLAQVMLLRGIANNLEVDLLNKMRALNEPLYQQIMKDNNIFDTLENKECVEFLNILAGEEKFNNIYNETVKYAKKVEAYWSKNKKFVNEYFTKVLKISPDVDFMVYINHPQLHRCFYYGNNIIFWGHDYGIKDPNYNLTYLVHESLHALLPTDYDKWSKQERDINHTIIELASDYEFYKRKNGTKSLQGHEHLNPFHEKIYPYWLSFLNLNVEQQEKRKKEDNIFFDINADKGNKEELSKIDIYQFRDFCFKDLKLSSKK